MIYSDVPAYLQDSQFALSLSPDEVRFEVPTDCYCDSSNIQNVTDLSTMFKTMVYWGLDYFPPSVLEFCFAHDYSVWSAVETGDLKIQALVQAFQNPNLFSLETALSIGQPAFTDFWLSKNDASSEHGKNAIAQACRFGRLDLVRELREKGYPWDSFSHCAAAQYGHLHVLEYLLNTDRLLHPNPIKYAARGGQLQCMKYLRSKGCKWDADVALEYAVPAHFVVLSKEPHIEPWTDDFTLGSPAGGYLDCLRYAVDNGCSIQSRNGLINSFAPYGRQAANRAVAYGLLDCLIILHEKGALFDSQCTFIAASRGRLDCLMYLHANGCAWGIDTTYNAAQRGHLECLRYAMEQGCSYDDVMLESAARARTVICLRYLIDELGMGMSELLFNAAFTAGRVESVKYLMDADCPVGEINFDIRANKTHDLVDADLVQCIEYSMDRRLKVSNNLIAFVSEWNSAEDSYKYPLCSAFLRQR